MEFNPVSQKMKIQMLSTQCRWKVSRCDDIVIILLTSDEVGDFFFLNQQQKTRKTVPYSFSVSWTPLIPN